MVKYITLLVIIVFSSSNGRHCHRALRKRRVCQTEGCHHTADSVRKYMDSKIDPCDNFYQFACGKFLRNTRMPRYKSVISSFQDEQNAIYTKLIKLVEKPPHYGEAKPFALVKMLYKTCMDKRQREKENNKPLKDILKDLGGWPVQYSNANWEVLIYKLRKLGYPVDTLINMLIWRQTEKSDKAMIVISQPTFLLSKGDIQDDKIVRGYYDLMVKAAVTLGAKEQLARKALNDSLEFELQLIKSSTFLKKIRARSIIHKTKTLAEIQKEYPSINWLKCIKKILNIRSIKITKNEKIHVHVPEYIEHLARMLKRFSRCAVWSIERSSYAHLNSEKSRTAFKSSSHDLHDKAAVANYIMWRAVFFAASFLTESLFNIKAELQMVKEGTLSKLPRDLRCITHILDNTPIAIASLYVRKVFDESLRPSARKMIKKLKSAFGGMLNKTKWLDEVTKGYALEKLDSMRSIIGYDDRLVDDQILDEYYLDLEVHPNNYLKQILNVSRFNIDKDFSSLRQNQDEIDWTLDLLVLAVNAAYDAAYNKINIPAAILQEYAFSKDTPQYMSYGAIGFIIGHEIVHGFDNENRLYDKDGEEVDWWTDEARKVFDKKATCFVNQYSNITVPVLNYTHLNGEISIGENIADNGGIRAAYKAYKNLAKHKGTEPYLPNLNYSPNQMFWISFAYKSCEKYTPQVFKEMVQDVHLPLEFRVIVSLRNSKAFSKDFHCPLGSNMNPHKKCRLW